MPSRANRPSTTGWEYLWLTVGKVGPVGRFGGQRTGWRSSDDREWEASEEWTAVQTLGQEGWELVATPVTVSGQPTRTGSETSSSYWYIFKRPTP